ncbi:MAG: hypothetical protein HYU37_01980 [Acidobacteria bacterium]|nr:hypothetical protein [Acidobacteriota bacterium]
MDDKRARPLDSGTDDAHEADEALTRDPDQYVAGAEGTQRITTPASAEAPAGGPAREQ